MSSFRLNNGFRLQKTNRAAIRWKQPPKKPFHHVSRDKILHDSWSISAAFASSFSDRHFERGEGPEDEVVFVTISETMLTELETANEYRFRAVGKLVGTDSDRWTLARYLDVFSC